MKLNLVSFAPDSFESTSRVGVAKLHVSSGRFNLSKPAKDITGLSVGDKVMVHQDEDDPATWYLSKEKAGFEIKKQKQGLAFYSNPLMQTILDAFGEEKHITFIMEDEPVKFNNKDYWKFSPSNREHSAHEESEEEEASSNSSTNDGDQKLKGKGAGRKKGSKNKPATPLFI